MKIILRNLVLTLTGFLLIEQLLITDGTVAPLNRLRTIYAFGAAFALFIFGIGAAIVASRWYGSSSPDAYQHSKHFVFVFYIELIKRNAFFLLGAVIASVIAFVGMTVYFGEALARNRKSRII